MCAFRIIRRRPSPAAGFVLRLFGALAVGALAVVVSAQPARAARAVYVANLGLAELEVEPGPLGKTLAAFSIAPDGSLDSIAGSPFPTGGSEPLGVAMTPDGRYLYVTNLASESVSAFAVAADGSLSAVPGSPFAAGFGPWGVAVSPDGKHLYVVDNRGYGASAVSAFSIAGDGSLSAVVGSPFATGGESADEVAVTPDGTHLYVTNQDSENISAFSIAPNGSLAPVPGSPFATIDPRGVAVTPGGEYLYVTNNFNAKKGVAGFSIAPDGSLTPVPGSPFATEGSPISLAVSPDGTNIYVVNNGNPNTVWAFSIAPDGSLSAVVGSPFPTGGWEPNSVAVSPDGRHVYVTAYRSSTVSAFSVAPDGGLSAVVGSPFATGEGPLKVVVSPDQGPVAAYSETPGPAGYPSAFDASASSDAEGAVAGYRWEFGDGHTETTSTPATTHTYAAVGPYTVTLTATDEAGCSTTQTFTGQTVSCNGSPLARISHQVTVPTPELLNVWLDGSGAGTVASSPAGMSCPSTCTYGYAAGSGVVLTATAVPGSTFAGWLGCRHLTATECEVTMSEASEVTAVFLKEAEAPVIAPFSGSRGGCANGGLEVAVSGRATYICDGVDGTNGAAGTNGTEGREGPPGREGSQGKAGPRGPKSSPSNVTCRVKQEGKQRAGATCTVTDGASSSRHIHLRWRLIRDGRTVSHGTSDGGRLHLRRLRPGRYLLFVQGARRAAAIVVG